MRRIRADLSLMYVNIQAKESECLPVHYEKTEMWEYKGEKNTRRQRKTILLQSVPPNRLDDVPLNPDPGTIGTVYRAHDTSDTVSADDSVIPKSDHPAHLARRWCPDRTMYCAKAYHAAVAVNNPPVEVEETATYTAPVVVSAEVEEPCWQVV